jgi:hypothetical protein
MIHQDKGIGYFNAILFVVQHLTSGTKQIKSTSWKQSAFLNLQRTNKVKTRV